MRVPARILESYVRIAGNSSTSRRLSAPVSIITRRSMPRPTPPVGGIPCSSASTKASSKGWASSSPRAELGRLLLEAAALLVGVVELAEGVGDLDPADERLPALDQALLGAVRLGEGRELDRIVEDEGRLDQARARPRGEQAVDQLAPALGRVGLGPHRRRQRLPGRVLGDVDRRPARGSPRAG